MCLWPSRSMVNVCSSVVSVRCTAAPSLRGRQSKRSVTDKNKAASEMDRDDHLF